MEIRLRYTSWINSRYVAHSNKVDENIKRCPLIRCQLTSTIVHTGSSPVLTTKKNNLKLFKWQNGRQQGCDYRKFPLWFFRIRKFGFDAYILKYQSAQILPPHRDPIERGKHWRLNIGYGNDNFVCESLIFGCKLGLFTIYIFRPDLYEHSLQVYDNTTKLSIGFAVYK